MDTQDKGADMNYAMSYPALNGETVTEGHVQYCEANGHTTYIKDGVDMKMCPRCGAASVEAEKEEAPVFVWYFRPNTNERVMAVLLGEVEGTMFSRVRRVDNGKVYRVPTAVLRSC